MHANLDYEISKSYKYYGSRLIQFVKHNFILYIPDFILLTILAVPPYQMQETLMIITALVLLGFRDIVVMRRSINYLKEFKVNDSAVEYSVLRYNQVYENRKTHISKIVLQLQEDSKPYTLDIYDEGVLVHRQYAIGYWSMDYLKELYTKFSNLKKDMNLEIMFKGTF